MSISWSRDYIFGRGCHACLFWLCGPLVTLALGQIPPRVAPLATYERLPLNFIQDEGMNRSWKVTRVELREGLVGTWGLLQIQNVSGMPIQQARFYADYYDMAGRLCFTLVFGSDSNSESLKGDPRPVGVDESRLLLSLGSGFAPASEAVEARVRLVSQTIAGKPEEIVAGDRILRSPGVIEGSILELKLRLAIDPLQRGALDLVFAKVAVNKEGGVEELTVLNSVGSDAAAWFERVIRGKEVFRPATIGFANTESTALVLVRIASSTYQTSFSVPVARESPWVKAYVRTVRDRELPPITELLFVLSTELSPDSEPQRSRSKSDPNIFEFISAGSFWCDTLLVWDPVSPSRPWTLRWRTPDE